MNLMANLTANLTVDHSVVGAVIRVLMVCACVLSSGCGIKLMYNNVDRLIAWELDDYVDLTSVQNTYLREQLDVVMYWHRTTQLPEYAVMLREIDDAVSEGLTREHLAVFEEQMLGHGEAALEKFVPVMAEILYDLSQEQVAGLARRSEKVNQKYLKEVDGLTTEERQQRWANDFRDGFAMFVGKVTSEQKAIVEAQQERYRPEEEVWVEYRRRWQNNLQLMLAERGPFSEFELKFRDLALNRERWYGPEYEAVFKHNEQLYRDLTLALTAAMTEKQHAALTGKLTEWAQAFEELAVEGEAPANAKPCLVTCPDQRSSSTSQATR